MESRENVVLSKRMAFVLRHRPDSVGLSPDAGGWVGLDELCSALGVHRDAVEAVVRSSGKQRYAIAEGRIRAQQGHSIPVDLGYLAQPPPDVLWHGTAARFLRAIRRDGLQRQGRHAVHLSADPATARQVGARHGTPVVLRVDSGRMARDGYAFAVSGNGVWLTDHVPPHYLTDP